jgi:hypothetical protein
MQVLPFNSGYLDLNSLCKNREKYELQIKILGEIVDEFDWILLG